LGPELPGTREALQEVAQRHQIAAISNTDGKIAELLQRCEIGGCFRTVIESGVLGN